MSENAYEPEQSGQEVQQTDLQQVGATSGLADDHVFAEALRLSPFNGTTVDKAIIPSDFHGTSSPAVVVPSGSSNGAVLVNPFRAVVGSRNTVTSPPNNLSTDSDALANWRDIRSGVFVGGSAALQQQFVLAPNASGNARWDLVYAAITPDSAGPSVNRRVKNPTSGNVTVVTVPAYVYSPVVVAVITGTPSSTPALPALPADGAGQYNIPLAYVRVPTGFNSTTLVDFTDIRSTTKNALSKYRTLKPGLDIVACNGNNDANATFDTTGAFFSWDPTTSGSRPGPWLPPDLVGGKTCIAEIDNISGTAAAWSHQSLGIVDSSTDWTRRFIKVTSCWSTGSSTKFGNDPELAVTTAAMPNVGATQAVSLACSFESDGSLPPSTTTYVTTWTATVGARTVALLVDMANGNLVWYSSSASSTGARYFFWIEASGQFPNTSLIV